MQLLPHPNSKIAIEYSHETERLFHLGPVQAKLDDEAGFIIPPEFCTAIGVKVGDGIVMTWKDGELCIAKTPQRKRGTRRRVRK
jgi:hypothetical protein